MNAFSLYCKMIGISIRGQLQYKASFVLYTIGNALGAFIEYLGVWALFSRFETMQGWTLSEAAIFFGMGNIAFALCEAFMREFDIFHRHVRTGEFDRMLLRPRGTVLQMLGAQCQILRIGRLLQGVVVFAIGVSGLPFVWSTTDWMLLVLAILGGTLLFAGLAVLQATSAFWTIESIEVWSCLTFGGLTAIQYPLSVYPKALRYLFTYMVPLVSISYWPCAVLLRRTYASSALAWGSPLVGFAFFVGSLCIWRVGIRHYRSTGS